MLCKFPGCENETNRTNSFYCSKHRILRTICPICHKEKNTKPSDFLKGLKRNNIIDKVPIDEDTGLYLARCNSCAVSERNKTPKMREISRQTGLRTGKINIHKAIEWYKTEEGKQLRHKIGITQGKKNLQNYSKKPETIEFRRNLMKEIGSLNPKFFSEKSIIKRKQQIQEHIKSVNNGFWKTSEGLKLRQELAKYLGHEVVYSRDDNGNITHIDGVPIEEKYKVISNRHWLDEKIKSNQQETIRDDDIPIDNSFFVSTGRCQNSDSWKGKEGFDRFLVNLGIGWFVYIKFDILGNPLVVGKTGTRMVSNSINDIVFDYWERNNGPARQYLRDNGLDWDKTKVLVISCNTEQEALNKEKEIHDKYDIFYS